MSMLPPWKVTETRYDEMGRITRVIHHTRIGTALMSESDARGFAAMETARYANARLRRTFHPEPLASTAGSV